MAQKQPAAPAPTEAASEAASEAAAETEAPAAEETAETDDGSAKADRLAAAGVTILQTPAAADRNSSYAKVDLKHLMAQLGERKIDSVLIEGGSKINADAFASGIVDKVYAYVGGVIIGGADAPAPVGGRGAETMAGAVKLRDMEVIAAGEDFCITGYPEYSAWTRSKEVT